MSEQLTHLDETGAARMVDVGHKDHSERVAVAEGRLLVSPETLMLISRGETPKGDVIAVARVAGIMAAKRTSELIPLCHQLALTSVKVEVTPNMSPREGALASLDITASARCVGQTGVEMEALTAVSVCALTLYDMLKAVDTSMVIDQVRLTEKRGGKRDVHLAAQHTPSAPLTSPSLKEPSLIPPPPMKRAGFKVVAKGEQLPPSSSPIPEGPISESLAFESPASESAVARQRFDELGELSELEGAEGAERLRYEEQVTTARASSESEEGLMSSCPPPKVPMLASVTGVKAHESPSDEEEPWEESLLHEGSFEGESESEGTLNAPALSQAAREMSVDVREVPLSYPPLKRFLLTRPLDAAYLLGYLTPEYESSCRAFIYERPDEEASASEGEETPVRVEALLFEYTGLSVPTIWTYGATVEVEAVIAHVYAMLPRNIYINMEDHHLQAVRTHYRVRHRRPTLRMGLKRAHFVPAGNKEGVVSLSHKDTGGIMRLYHQYPDHLFEPAQLETGLYCGVRDEEGNLISVAGIHFLNPSFNIAAIGNIVTDAAHRGEGLATRCVRGLLDELFERVDNVALNVTEDNIAAITCYEKFGFRTTSRIIEARARLR